MLAGTLPPRNLLDDRQHHPRGRRRDLLRLTGLSAAALAFTLCGCPASQDTDTDKPIRDTGVTADTGEPDPSIQDEALLRALLDGAEPGPAAVEDVLATIALSGGMPIETETGFLFATTLEGDGLALAGDFNDWQAAPMQQHGALRWLEVPIADPIDAGYKFVDSAATWQADPWARRYNWDTFGELSYVRASLPHLERWPGFAGDQGLASRTLRVWVPQDGSFDRILYAHDGQNLFDPGAMWGGWHLQESVPDNMLVVGIDNSWDRDFEYTHVEDFIYGEAWGGGGDLYADFVQEDIRPWIEAHYGTASIQGLLGSSLGGLISLHIAARHEGAYDFAASMSGTLGWGSIGADNETMIERYQAAGHGDTAIYLDSGGGPGCPDVPPAADCADLDGDGTQDDVSLGDNYCETAQMRDVLAGVGYTFGVDLWHWHEPCAEHDEMAWAGRVSLPLGIFAGL